MSRYTSDSFAFSFFSESSPVDRTPRKRNFTLRPRSRVDLNSIIFRLCRETLAFHRQRSFRCIEIRSRFAFHSIYRARDRSSRATRLVSALIVPTRRRNYNNLGDKLSHYEKRGIVSPFGANCKRCNNCLSKILAAARRHVGRGARPLFRSVGGTRFDTNFKFVRDSLSHGRQRRITIIVTIN